MPMPGLRAATPDPGWWPPDLAVEDTDLPHLQLYRRSIAEFGNKKREEWRGEEATTSCLIERRRAPAPPLTGEQQRRPDRGTRRGDFGDGGGSPPESSREDDAGVRFLTEIREVHGQNLPYYLDGRLWRGNLVHRQ